MSISNMWEIAQLWKCSEWRRGGRTNKEPAMGSSGEHSDSAIPTGGPSMNVRLAFALLPLLLLGSPVYAQSPCSECLKAAEKELADSSSQCIISTTA